MVMKKNRFFMRAPIFKTITIGTGSTGGKSGPVGAEPRSMAYYGGAEVKSPLRRAKSAAQLR